MNISWKFSGVWAVQGLVVWNWSLCDSALSVYWETHTHTASGQPLRSDGGHGRLVIHDENSRQRVSIRQNAGWHLAQVEKTPRDVSGRPPRLVDVCPEGIVQLPQQLPGAASRGGEWIKIATAILYLKKVSTQLWHLNSNHSSMVHVFMWKGLWCLSSYMTFFIYGILDTRRLECVWFIQSSFQLK